MKQRIHGIFWCSLLLLAGAKTGLAQPVPAITEQPQSQSVLIGSNAIFNVAATGQAPLTYQWLSNNIPINDNPRISGTHSTQLIISNVASADAANYSVVVSDRHADQTTSQPATLTVLVPPSIAPQPQSVATFVSSNVTFTAGVSGAPIPSVRWQFNGAPLSNGGRISGATSTTLTISNAQILDGGNYQLIASNSVGSATSQVAQLSFNLPPTILSHPQSQSVILGQDAELTVRASGTQPLRYQLRFNGADVPGWNAVGGTGWDFFFPINQTSRQGNYSFVVSNDFGFVISSNAFVTVLVPPSFTQQPQSQTKAIGGSVTFSANATGTAPLSFQWFFGSAPLSDSGRVSGANTPLLSISNLLAGDAGNYSLTVSNAAGVTNSSLASLTVLAPVTITQQPENQTAVLGSNAQFSVSANGGGVIGYRWRLNGNPLSNGARISGAQSATLTISNLLSTDAGNYSVLVTNEVSSLPSSNAALTVLIPPGFVQQPTNQNVAVSSNLTLTALANGAQPIHYQWFYGGAVLSDDARISGATTSSLAIANATTNDSGGYWVVASNVAGVATSAVAIVTVGIPPNITQQPIGLTNAIGSNPQLNVLAGGTEPINFQWRFNGANISDNGHRFGTTTSTLTISNAVAGDSGSYSVVVSSAFGSVTSEVAVVSILQSPSITGQPIGRSLPAGLQTTFNSTANGAAPLSYQWQFNGTNILGATTNSYTITAVSAANVGNYRMIASNTVGSATSVVAQVTIGPVATWGTFSFAANIPLLSAAGLSNVIAIAGGQSYSLALRDDGSIYSWGNNFATNLPAGLSGVVGIAGGQNHALALLTNGVVVAWGLNSLGQTNVPSGLSNVVAVAAGISHSVALRNDGTVVVWGDSRSRQTNVPPDLIKVKSVDAGGSQTLALREDGTVVGWGGPVSPPFIPSGLSDVAALSAGSFNLAAKSNGQVVAWIQNGGLSTNVPAGLNDIIAVEATGAIDTPNLIGVGIGLRSNGTVIAWGSGSSLTNVPFGLSNVVSLASGNSHALALVNDGKPLIIRPPVGGTFYTGRDLVLKAKVVGNGPLSFRWKRNGVMLDNATNETLVLPSAQFSDGGSYQLIASNALGFAQSLAVPVTIIDSPPFFFSQPTNRFAYFGSPFSLGASVAGSGPLDLQWFKGGVALTSGMDEIVSNRAQPEHGGAYQLVASNPFGSITSSVAQVTFSRIATWGSGPSLTNAPVDLGTVVAMASGYFHALAIKPDGTVAAWGTTLNGATNVPAGLSDVVAVSGGANFSVALRGDGTVAAWGLDNFGQTNVPAGLDNVIAISAGASHALALRAGGTIVAWGSNASGQRNVPAGLSNVIAIAAGSIHSLALKNDGTIVGWGAFGKIPSHTNVVAIAAGYGQSLALQADGTVQAWSTGGQSTGLPPGLNNVVAISAGGGLQGWFHSVALKADGTLVAWGNNSVGQLNAPSDLLSSVKLSAGGGSTMVFLNDRSPAITVPLFNRHSIPGATVALPAMTVGQPSLAYQWRFNGLDISGATDAVLNLANVNRSSKGIYSALISNSLGATNTRNMQLEVGGSLQFSQPFVGVGGEMIFSAHDSLGGTLSVDDIPFFTPQVSTNLVDWEPLPNSLTISNGVLRLHDTDSTNYPARFYRLLETE